jgi:hypothetical protein
MTPTLDSVASLVGSVRSALGPSCLRSDWRKRRPADAAASWGCCYVACEAVYHAAGGAASGLRPMHVRHEGGPHWFLRGPGGEVVDPTADQFCTPPPYELGRGVGFLTLAPSRRARALLAASGLT